MIEVTGTHTVSFNANIQSKRRNGMKTIVPCKGLCRIQRLVPSKAERITRFSFCNSALSASAVWSRLNGRRVQPWREPAQDAARQARHEGG
jgi:hypothetical protein